MSEFTLLPDEVVIKKDEEVGLEGFGPFGMKKNTLILTNRDLVLVKKSMLRKVKGVERYPLSDIVISNGMPQVHLGKLDNVTHTLDVYFKTGEKHFIFTWEDDIKDWCASITETITGVKVERKNEDSFADDILIFSDKIDKAMGKFRKAFGIKSTTTVSATCPGCGAPLTGHEGETVKCPYCGSYHTF